MDFNNTQAIYLQLKDWMCEQLLSGKWEPGGRIPSIRELAVQFEVNPNTMMRAYEHLQQTGIIHNKRGIGYFASEDAVEKILQIRRQKFIDEEIPAFVRKMKLYRVDWKEVEGINPLKFPIHPNLGPNPCK